MVLKERSRTPQARVPHPALAQGAEAHAHASAGPRPAVLPGARAGAGTLSPPQVLALQRSVGNQATQRVLGGARANGPAARGVVQRTMYLHNADDNIYRDSAGGTTDVAYVSKGRVPFFIEYDRVTALRSNATLRDWAGQNERSYRRAVDDVARTAQAGNPGARTVIDDLGAVYAVEDGNVVHVPLDLDRYEHQMLVGKLVWDALTDGASYWHVGGGSRTPRAQGTLYFRSDLARDPHHGPPLEDSVAERLGLSVGDLASVAFQHVRPDLMKAVAHELRADGENLYEYSAAPGQGFPDLVYVSGVRTTRSANSRVACAGTLYQDDLGDADANARQELEASWQRLLPVRDSGWIHGTHVSRRDRGAGQFNAMERWNALGAAAYANAFHGQAFPLDQNWEWLHVRGAGLGGATEGGNLVAGLFVTNSAMIPFERMIREWAEADPTRFWVRFGVEPLGNDTVFARRITFSIAARDHRVLGDLEHHPWVWFDPLSGRVVDRVAGEFIKRRLDQNPHLESVL